MKSLALAIILVILFYVLVPINIQDISLKLLGAYFLGDLLFKLTHKLTGEKQ
jgi:uncharacterized integral membrane protein